MFKSIGTWMACAAMLSSGLFAQDAPKANPIEVKEQKGEVLGSLGQERSPFIPKVSINAGWQTKQFKRGVMWDQNTNADLDVEFKWYPVENGELTIGINGRFPTRNSRNAYTVEKKRATNNINRKTFYFHDLDGFMYDLISVNLNPPLPTKYEQFVYDYKFDSISEKINFSHDREENELDEKELRLSYTQTFKELPFIDNDLGDVSVTVGWSYFKENDIYSKINPKYQLQPFNNFYFPYYINEIFEKEGNLFDKALQTAIKMINFLNKYIYNEDGSFTEYVLYELLPESFDEYILQEIYINAYNDLVSKGVISENEFDTIFTEWSKYAKIINQNYLTSVNRQIK